MIYVIHIKLKMVQIILSDRRSEYIENNMSLCEDNCEYGGYNSNTKKSICQCDIETKSTEKENKNEQLLIFK